MALFWNKLWYDTTHWVADVLQGRRLSEACVNDDIERKIFKTYESIHDLGVIHGDIRPENLLVLEDGSVRIIDFDNAAIFSLSDINLIGQEKDEIKTMLESLRKSDSSCTQNGNSHWTV